MRSEPHAVSYFFLIVGLVFLSTIIAYKLFPNDVQNYMRARIAFGVICGIIIWSLFAPDTGLLWIP